MMYITEIKRCLATDPDPKRCLHEALTFAEHEQCIVELTISDSSLKPSIVISIAPNAEYDALYLEYKRLAAQVLLLPV